MLRFARGSAVVLVSGLWLAAVQAALVGEVQDKGGFFKPEAPEAVEKANRAIKKIQQEFKKDLLIETYASIPAGKDEELKDQGKEKFFSAWAIERAKAADVKGIYILLCKEPKYYQIEISADTRNAAGFTRENYQDLNALLRKDLGAGKYDRALLDSVDFVEKTLRANATKKGSAPTGGRKVADGRGGQGFSLGGLLCIGLVAILAIWLVVGLVRGLGAGGMGGMGGGGSFLTGLLGGLFGAAAGMWLYDSFFRGSAFGGDHHPDAGGGDAAGGSDAGAWGGNDDYSGGGGDYGGGGGDFGGGGDIGGGGDFGGGGDW